MRTTACLILCLLGCLVLSPWLEGAETKACANGWLHYGHKCYGFFKNKKSWAEAEVECQTYCHRAHLVSILNKAETNVIAEYILRKGASGRVWIGLHDPWQTRKWTWTDGSIYNYKAWRPGQPDSWYGVEHCAELLAYRGYQEWNDNNCRNKNSFICKYQL
ncbi:regenerating islet-derived protein 4-like [Alligator mississippiensis]|uniref:regenerating islet-derived protein 4-like n=1 Tax=Alligator mississippiensis TaxID=8496 RepID=UPI0028777EEE|nr:regenerating islet-derived protein 4-like [Alligator mississippiensis]